MISRTTTLLLAIASLMMLHQSANAFQLSMVASSGNRPANSLRMPFMAPPVLPGVVSGVSSNLISQLAVIALKLRLQDHKDVTCNVVSKSSDLVLQGRVGPVTVTGKGWKSSMGLTCRAIEAVVDTCELDTSAVLARRKLVLNRPALGKAMVAMNSVDFGNFITHPLMKPPAVMAGGSKIEFCKEGAEIDASTGSVTFLATLTGSNEESRWKCQLARGDTDNARARIQVSLVEGEVENEEDMAHSMGQVLSVFFNKMEFEVGGTFLSFRDMMVTDKGAAPSVMLALSIRVHKFPSPKMQF